MLGKWGEPTPLHPERDVYLVAMTASEVLAGAARLTSGRAVEGLTAWEIARLLTVASYVRDVCIRELEGRDVLERDGNALLLPDARPDELFVEHHLTRSQRS